MSGSLHPLMDSLWWDLVDDLVVEVYFFYWPLEEEVVEHQHLVPVPPFDHGRHGWWRRWINHLYIIFIIFRLDVSNRNVLHDLPQWFITYIIKILMCSLRAVRFIKFHIICFFNQAGAMIKYSMLWTLMSNQQENQYHNIFKTSLGVAVSCRCNIYNQTP